MKLYYTVWKDEGGYPQIYQLSSDLNKLDRFIWDESWDESGPYKHACNIYVYDTDSNEVLTADSACNKTLYQKGVNPFKIRNVSNEWELLEWNHPKITFNDTHDIVTIIDFDRKKDTLEFISLIAPSAEWIDESSFKCTPEECWQMYCRFPSKTDW